MCVLRDHRLIGLTISVPSSTTVPCGNSKIDSLSSQVQLKRMLIGWLTRIARWMDLLEQFRANNWKVLSCHHFILGGQVLIRVTQSSAGSTITGIPELCERVCSLRLAQNVVRLLFASLCCWKTNWNLVLSFRVSRHLFAVEMLA